MMIDNNHILVKTPIIQDDNIQEKKQEHQEEQPIN